MCCHDVNYLKVSARLNLKLQVTLTTRGHQNVILCAYILIVILIRPYILESFFFIVMGNLFVNANFHNSVNIRILNIKFFIHKCSTILYILQFWLSNNLFTNVHSFVNFIIEMSSVLFINAECPQFRKLYNFECRILYS